MLNPERLCMVQARAPARRAHQQPADTSATDGPAANTGEPCAWPGVTCVKGSAGYSLDLSKKGLAGTCSCQRSTLFPARSTKGVCKRARCCDMSCPD